MSTFNRGLDDAFVEALNQEYDKGGWWRRFVVDQDVFLAIRENHVNVYYRGCSLLKIEFKDRAIVGQIHYKYLLRPSTPNKYVKVEDGRASLDDMECWFLTDVNDIDSLKKAVEPYAGDEKTGIQDILKANFNILDVEIAFGKDESESGAPRLDFAALQDSGDGVMKVVFFEAKRFDDDKALRKQDAEKPEVVEQMETYRSKLCANRDAIIESYCRVCSNLRSLHGVAEAERHPKRHAMLESVASVAAELTIDEEPVLIVFGFDGDQKVGKHWQPHREKLKKMLKGRVHLRGNSAGFRSGISK